MTWDRSALRCRMLHVPRGSHRSHLCILSKYIQAPGGNVRMRQLGIRSPESPPVETDMETPSEILPHERFAAEPSQPVEVHRVERNPVGAESGQSRETVAADADADAVPLPDERLALE